MRAQKSTSFAVVVGVLSVTLAFAGACDSTGDNGAGGGAAEGTVTGGGAAQAGCSGPADGTCALGEGEGCGCVDCQGAALCNPGQCVDDGVCTLLDSCPCADCVDDDYCGSELGCEDDGVCEPFYEGCACADCAAEPGCG